MGSLVLPLRLYARLPFLILPEDRLPSFPLCLAYQPFSLFNLISSAQAKSEYGENSLFIYYFYMIFLSKTYRADVLNRPVVVTRSKLVDASSSLLLALFTETLRGERLLSELLQLPLPLLVLSFADELRPVQLLRACRRFPSCERQTYAFITRLSKLIAKCLV